MHLAELMKELLKALDAKHDQPATATSCGVPA